MYSLAEVDVKPKSSDRNPISYQKNKKKFFFIIRNIHNRQSARPIVVVCVVGYMSLIEKS